MPLLSINDRYLRYHYLNLHKYLSFLGSRNAAKLDSFQQSVEVSQTIAAGINKWNPIVNNLCNLKCLVNMSHTFMND